jgi:hypothetical protein
MRGGWYPRRAACIAYFVSKPCASTSSGRLTFFWPLAEQSVLLAPEVAEVPPARLPRQERRRERPQLVAELGPGNEHLLRHEQQQEDRGIPLHRESDVLAQAGGDEVEVARPDRTPSGFVRST